MDGLLATGRGPVQPALNSIRYEWSVGRGMWALAAMALLGAVPASAQAIPVPDAPAVAERLGLPVEDAGRQLRLQEASVAATDAIATRFADRLAGIAVEHRPAFRIVVRLTGDAPVADEVLALGGDTATVTYRTGAAASLTALVQALTSHQAAIRASLRAPPGMGVDQRTGELVIVVSRRDVAQEGEAPLRARLADLAGVPVRLRVVDDPALDLSGPAGGMRLLGGSPGSRRSLCTAGFVVTDGTQTALATAAHCADTLAVRGGDGQEQVLPFLGQWGWGYQDVQINAAAGPLAPTFFADTAKTQTRTVAGARGAAGTRAGDIVCHRGERTGYSCAPVELTHFAPAGDLCGGACLPTWVTVAGPGCKGGDSGSPVFLGTTAFGILKGGSYRSDGSCAFYFYMSTDYLPPGWRLLTAADRPLQMVQDHPAAPTP